MVTGADSLPRTRSFIATSTSTFVAGGAARRSGAGAGAVGIWTGAGVAAIGAGGATAGAATIAVADASGAVPSARLAGAFNRKNTDMLKNASAVKPMVKPLLFFNITVLRFQSFLV